MFSGAFNEVRLAGGSGLWLNTDVASRVLVTDGGLAPPFSLPNTFFFLA